MSRYVLLDFHSHILPGMDDGAEHPQESVSMLREEKKAGITDVCLTPHYYAHENSISSFLNRRQHMYARLRSELRTSFGTMPDLHLGAEVHFYEGMAEDPLLDLLCSGASKLILVEPPMRKWSSSFYEELGRVKSERGLQPVIAHLDRYVSILNDRTLVSKVRSNGFLIQCNVEFFLHPVYRSLACDLLRSREIAFIGSDAHNLSGRPVRMKPFLRFLRQERLDEVFYSMSAKGVRLLHGANSVNNTSRRSLL